MKFFEFRRLFGFYVPDRISDAYLERLFRAFCYTSPYPDQLTFKDLIECLSMVCGETPRTNALWTWRLIKNGQQTEQGKITPQVDLKNFINYF